MSLRSDKNEKTPGAKMLKKAQSFREDLRNRIRRRPSQQMIPDDKRARKSKGDSTLSIDSQGEEDVDELKKALSEVNKTLGFIKAVVSHGKLEVLPGSASVILETVMQIFTLLQCPKLAQESNAVMSSHSKVCQQLASFIQWTDNSLVGEVKDKPDASTQEVIDLLLEGLKELTNLGVEKLAQKKANSNVQIPIHKQPLPSPPSDMSSHGSLPDIPLTPREQKILQETSGNLLDNRTSNSSTNSSVFSFDPHDGQVPPPKPPLRNSTNQDSVNGNELIPPPLPEKRRNPSINAEILDSLSSRTSNTPHLTNSASLDHSLGMIRQTPTGCQDNSTPTTIPSISPHAGSHSSFPTYSTHSSSSSSTVQQISHQSYSDGNVTKSFSRTVSDSKIVNNSQVKKVQGKAFDEINELTSQIKKLTNCIEEIPPQLPAKKGSLNRLNSQYDNVPECLDVSAVGSAGSLLSNISSLSSSSSSSCTQQQRTAVVMRKDLQSRSSSASSSSIQSSHSSQSQSMNQQQRSVQGYRSEERTSSHETYSSSETFSSISHSSTESLPKPPPLPPKKRHVQAYIQMFGSVSQPGVIEENMSRHSITFYESQWQQHQRDLSYPRSNTISVFSDISSDSSTSEGSSERLAAIPSLPIKRQLSSVSHGSAGQLSTGSSQSDFSLGDITSLPKSPAADSVSVPQRLSLPQPVTPRIKCDTQQTTLPQMAPLAQPEIQKDSDSDFSELGLLDDVDISDQLVFKQEGEDGPEVRGGAVEALIVHATQAGKIGSDPDVTEQREFMYQEAFLTTYRMFISPKALMEKLLYRFNKFHHMADNKKKLSHNAFSLLIRVVDELGVNELDNVVVERLNSLVYELICEGTLNLARLLRMKLLEKCEKKQTELADSLQPPVNPVQNIELNSSSDLLSFKAHDIAEQMTLLDAQLFQKIEIPEVLMWAREQSEELSPHLTQFTEHFNKMSYWCQTRVLTQDDPKDRERYLIKFIKIMKYLRKLHNFNSYLAILSALESAPVRRLEWQKQNIEALQEFCQLIDSSSSFRTYRQALAETDPPCIPYLGLILQDLTFINIGNQDKLSDGSINFAKHWQQFHILDSMRRFRTSTYQIKLNPKIMNYLNNFEDFRNEEILWQISQKIKPRPGHKKQNSIS